MKIIDVSAWQENIDWDAAAPELDLVILRASVGQKIDTKYKRNTTALERLNIPYHAYHYVKATTPALAKTEAQVFANATNGSKPLFYIIDAEYSGIAAKNAKTIMETFEKELRRIVGQDIKVAIYIAHHLYNSWELDYNHYAYIWIPRYGKNTGNIVNSTKPSFFCDLWQYTEKGKVKGINGYVDMNVLNSDKPLSFFTQATSETPTKTEDVFLTKGNKNEYVKWMQCALIAQGYDLGSYGADGDFGSMTEKAVRAYQTKNRHVSTGTVTKTLYNEIFLSLIK